MSFIRALQIVLIFLFLNLGFILFWAQTQENLLVAFSQLWTYPWFKAILLEYYIGLFLFSLGVFVREKPFKACLWTLGFLVLGYFAVLAYVILSLNKLKDQKVKK